MVEISEVDVHDDAELRAFSDVEQAAHRAGRDRAVVRSYEIRTLLRAPNPYFRHDLMVAREGDLTVGTADLGCSVGDNEHLADLEITVHPDWQRRGIGSALFEAARQRLTAEGRTTVVGEAYVPDGVAHEQAAAYAFASGLGLRSVHVEDHLVLELPAVAPEGPVASGWEVVTWRAHCPDEFREAYCRMRTQMENDVPRGEVEYEPFVFDTERLRVGEERIARGYRQVVAAARRRSDGAFGGYSIVFVPYGETEALQDDTLVMPEHRGLRLGLALKGATLDVLSREHPELTSIHTWTSVDNAPMQRTNRAFGFVPVDRMHEMQGALEATDA
jgi:GNAT superfamily N-acetyltransferase